MNKRFVIVQNSLKTTFLFRYDYIIKLLQYGDVFIIAPNDDIESKAKFENLGVHIYDVPNLGGPIRFIYAILVMNLLIIKERYNRSVFISHFIVTALMCFFTLLPFNRKCILYIEGLGTLFSRNNHLKKAMKIRLKMFQGKVLFCNEDEKLEIGSSKDIVTGGIGINLNKFPVKDKVNDSGEYKLLYVGRLIKDKGVYDAISLLRLLLDNSYNVTLFLVGDIYETNPTSLTKNDLILLKEEFGNSIVFVGYSSDMVKWYQESDILILPSIREGFPVCVMEASSSGVPVIGYNVPGMKDAVIDNVNGKLCEIFDIHGMYLNILEMLKFNNLNFYKSTCSDYARKNFDSSKKTNKLLSEILNMH